MKRERIYFISDAHLGGRPYPDPHEQADTLTGFLRSIRQDAQILYIVGDLFDFWFEYRSVVPSAGARVLFELYALVQAGVRVVCLPGNHDVWLGGYLEREVGLKVTQGPVQVEHQGLTIHLMHGDEHRNDWRFRLSRGILKNRFCVALFRLLHPDLGALLARCTSVACENNAVGRGIQRGWGAFRAHAREILSQGVDVLVCGHYHRAEVESMAGGTLIVLGDWITEDTYAVLEGGEIRIEHWSPT